MSDYLKIAIKVGLIATISASLIAVFSSIIIPEPDFSIVTQAVSKGYAFLNYWVPGASVVIPVAVGLLSVQLAILIFQFAMIGVRWILKVNE